MSPILPISLFLFVCHTLEVSAETARRPLSVSCHIQATVFAIGERVRFMHSFDWDLPKYWFGTQAADLIKRNLWSCCANKSSFHCGLELTSCQRKMQVIIRRSWSKDKCVICECTCCIDVCPYDITVSSRCCDQTLWPPHTYYMLLRRCTRFSGIWAFIWCYHGGY